jgi:hypothetical protein
MPLAIHSLIAPQPKDRLELTKDQSSYLQVIYCRARNSSGSRKRDIKNVSISAHWTANLNISLEDTFRYARPMLWTLCAYRLLLGCTSYSILAIWTCLNTPTSRAALVHRHFRDRHTWKAVCPVTARKLKAVKGAISLSRNVAGEAAPRALSIICALPSSL